MPRRIGKSDAGDWPSSKFRVVYYQHRSQRQRERGRRSASKPLRFGFGPLAPQPGSLSIAKYCAPGARRINWASSAVSCSRRSPRPRSRSRPIRFPWGRPVTLPH